jgi:cysteine desulfurase
MIEPEKLLYLDNNATTAIDPAVLESMRPFLEEFFANPSSGYGFAAQVRDAIEEARRRVADLLGCEASEIVFTSGGTESNNTAFHSALQAAPDRRHVVTTAVEHSAVLRPAKDLERRGYTVTFLDVDKSGRLNLDKLTNAIRPDTALVSVMWANNETGVIFPIEEVAAIAHEKKVPFHTDAVQAAGKIEIKLGDVPLQFLSISGHKLHAPK